MKYIFNYPQRSPLKFTTDTSSAPSVMEVRIADKLKELNISFATEVIFAGCKNPKTKQPLRFDFYCPDLNLLIEYDGKEYHLKEEVRNRDRIKNDFARAVKINLVRLKCRDDVKDFFKAIEPKRGIKKQETPLLMQDIKKPEKLNYAAPHTSKEELNERIHKLKLNSEIEGLIKLKAESQQKYTERVKYLFDRNKPMFNAVVAYLRENRPAT